MSFKPGDTIYQEFCTSNSSGAATNADSLPTGTVNRNGTDDGAATVTVANIDTGRYKATFTLPGGYASGDSVSLSVSATVGGVTGKKAWGPWVLDGKRLSDVALDGSGRVQVQSGTGAGQISLTAGKVDVNDKTGFGLATAPPTAAQIAAVILANPTNLLSTDGSGRVGVNNLPVEFLTSAEQTELTTAISDLNSLLGRTDTAGTVATITTNIGTLLARLSQALLFDANGYVKANAETVSDKNGYSATISGGVNVTQWGGAALPTSFAANNLPSDYQQRSVAVTLPDPAPEGYGGAGGSTVLEVVTATGAGGPEVTATGSGG